ncbi:hypothetical protein WMY93_024818 [Mugilogobius chulae]|uniref:Endonuclease/exonuclease/phosphatase domain-containing protein n=1 Tax=Mugilogobius chulae TaxID=88201 RepID=A0AAW0N3Z9_9GOBI
MYNLSKEIFLDFYACCSNVSATLVYDRQSLLNIRASHETFLKRSCVYQFYPPPPLLASVPAYLRVTPFAEPRRKRSRRRRKRGGVLVKIRAYLRSGAKHACPTHGSLGSAALPRERWLIPVQLSGCRAGDALVQDSPPVEWSLASQMRLRSSRASHRGVNQENLRMLARGCSPNDEDILRMALLNVRSLTGKTFVLNDFFASRHLDFMYLTETWLRPGECSAFSELLPPGCSFLNSPRTSGKGGGLASVFKSSFKCRQCPSKTLSTFELQLFELQCDVTVQCALIYRPPKISKDFIGDFSNLVSEMALNYDHFLIVGDFNIHVCCDGKPLVKDFKAVVDSFNLTQWVNGPTHERGHILDLVLSYGLNVCIEDLCSTQISDHLPVLFKVKLPGSLVQPCALTRTRRIINADTAQKFSSAFVSFLPTLDMFCASTVDELIQTFDSSCTSVLDCVAPFKAWSPKTVSEPWLNDHTRALRRESRRAERRWKKDRLHVSLGILRESLRKYQKAVGCAKADRNSPLLTLSPVTNEMSR